MEFISKLDPTIIAKDLGVTTAAFATTHVLYKATKSYFQNNLSTWKDVKPSVQNRMAVEIALLPCRLVMGWCCLPIILNSFAPESAWTPLDTSRAIIACATMAGSYAYDLTIERADILSLIHHCFGPGMLIWIEASYATYTPADAVMIRLLISFVYFGAAMGGSLTTTILVLLKVLRPHISAQNLHTAISTLVWGLTINTFFATSLGTGYMAAWFNELYAHWGLWCLIPFSLSAFEYYLQWRWAVKFQLIADKLAVTVGLKKNDDKKQINVRQSLNNKYTYIKAVIGCWLVSYVGVIGLIGREAVREVSALMV